MIKIITDVFMYIIEAILIWYYANTLFEAKFSKSKNLIISLAINTFLFLIYQLNIMYLNGICLFICYSLFFIVFYNTNIKEAIFHSVIIIIIMLGTELLVMSTSTWLFGSFNALNNVDSAYIYVIVCSKLLFNIIIVAISKIFAKKNISKKNDKYYWWLFIIPISSILMMVAFRYMTYNIQLTTTMSTLWIVSSILVVFSNLLLFIIYEYSQKNAAELFDLKAVYLQEEQDKKYYDLIESSNNEMRGFAHDIKNHLIQISNIDNSEEVRLYIDNLINEVDKFSYAGISKNKMLDLIISKYVRLCEKKGIKFEVDAKTANLSYINDVDLSTLMNNLLDNAVESADKSNGGFVQLRVFSRNEQFDGLIIRNTCVEKPNAVNGQLYTTKKNKKLHGLGVSSINRIAKKYNAVYDWRYDADRQVFETDIAFKKQ